MMIALRHGRMVVITDGRRVMGFIRGLRSLVSVAMIRSSLRLESLSNPCLESLPRTPETNL